MYILQSNVISIAAGGHRARVLARRDSLVEQHLDLVDSIARAVAASLPRTFELDDLIQVGRLGLLRAATNYRPDEHNDTPFSAYARPVIRGAILDSARRGKYVENTRPSITEMPHPALECDAEGELDRARSRARLRRAVDGLAPRLKTVIQIHYGEDERLPLVGAALGVGKSRASQLHLEALQELRAVL